MIGVALTFYCWTGVKASGCIHFALGTLSCFKWDCESKNLIDYLLAELNYKRFMFKKLCILLIFSKLKVTKLFNRQISYAQLSVHDIHYLKDVKVDYSNCTVIGDRGYISAQVQLDLFETANIRLEVPYRCNQKEWKPTFPAFAKARKRIETIFSQLCDQFMIIRNYAKDTDGLFARIIGKISALTILQYINYKNEKPIDRVKYALF